MSTAQAIVSVGDEGVLNARLSSSLSDVLSELVKEQIRQRRYEPVVRLEFAPGADPALWEMLRTRFDLSLRLRLAHTHPAWNQPASEHPLRQCALKPTMLWQPT